MAYNRLLLVDELAIHVDDPLGQIEVRVRHLALRIRQLTTEDGNLTISLDGKFDIFC